MKILAYVLRLTNWLAAVLGGIIGFLWFADIISLNDVAILATQINTHLGLRVILVILAVYLVGFNLLYFIGNLFTKQYASHITLPTSGGNVSVAISAIEDSLQRTAKKLPDVSDVRIYIYKDKKSEQKPVLIKVNYSCWEETNIPLVTEKIQQVLEMRFKEIVSVKEPPIFQFTLSHIVEKEEKPPKRKEKPPPFERVFYGAEYPIEK